jgi:hypothetical protein
MYFKCLQANCMLTHQADAGQLQLYRYAFLPNGASGDEEMRNCSLHVSEDSLSYYSALDKASPVHVSRVPYQHAELIAQGYTPVWIPCL